MKQSFLQFIRAQLTKMPAVIKTDLSGQTVVVVGANTGIGYAATKHFATMNPTRLIMACRSKSKGEAAVKKLASETEYNAELWLVDLTQFSSVSAFADKFDREGGRLDILVMNAGLMTPRYEATVDGYETCLEVNNIATPLLSLRLLPHMVRTAEEFGTTPRLVTVASEVHYWADVRKELVDAPSLLEKLSDPSYCTPKNLGQVRYHFCKLLSVFFTRALQDKLSSVSCPVISICLTPNLCRTGFSSNILNPVTAFIWFYMIVPVIAFSAEEGSRQIVYASVGGRDEEDELRGAYIALSKITEPSDFVISQEGHKMQEQYWSELVMVLSKVDDKVAGIVNEISKA